MSWSDIVSEHRSYISPECQTPRKVGNTNEPHCSFRHLLNLLIASDSIMVITNRIVAASNDSSM